MGPCARGSKKEGKPKCLPQSKAQSLGKKGRASAASKKRREDPNPNRKGKAINVATKTKHKTNETVIDNYINQFEQQLDQYDIINESEIIEYLNIAISEKFGGGNISGTYTLNSENKIIYYTIIYKNNINIIQYEWDNGKIIWTDDKNNNGTLLHDDIKSRQVSYQFRKKVAELMLEYYGDNYVEDDDTLNRIRNMKESKINNDIINEIRNELKPAFDFMDWCINMTENNLTVNEDNIKQLDELKCWTGYTRVKGVPQGAPGSCKKKVNEIITVDELVPLSFDKSILINHITDKNYKDNIYYGYSGSTLVVAAKENNQMIACAVCVKYKNPHYDLLPEYYVPKNMYSWIKDNGITTTSLIKAIIQISDVPVLSDIEMTPYAKKSFKKKIENNDINAKIFNICDGTISAYDSNIWENDDECRVIFFEHRMGKPQITLSESQRILMNYKYNWKDIVKYKNWKYQ